MKNHKCMSFISALLILCMVFSMCTGSVQAKAATSKSKQTTVTVSGVKYKISSKSKKTATVVSASKKLKSVNVASTVKIGKTKYKVTSISKKAFYKCSKLKSVTIGTNIKKISASAFARDKNLVKIKINSTALSKIEKNAFYDIKKTAVFYTPGAKLSKYKKLICKKSIGWKKTMNVKKIPVTSRTVSGVTYKITSTANKTAAAVKSKSTITAATIPATVKIDGKTYSISSVSKNTFKDCKKLKSVIIGANVKSVGEAAFYGAKNLKKITIKSTKLTKIGKNAFKGINAKASFSLPAKKYTAYKKLIKKKSVGWESTITFSKSKKEYTYSVVPFTEGLCRFFYIKTDNPDPNSFYFVDPTTTMTIAVCTDAYADVIYTNAKKSAVKGGYIFECNWYPAGGTWEVHTSGGSGSTTDIYPTVKIPKLWTSEESYLIDKYTNSKMSFFEKLTAVQDVVYRSYALYSRSYVRGTLTRDTELPYYGIQSPAYADQTYYIVSPYDTVNDKPLLLSKLYSPWFLDSIAFPCLIWNVAKELDSSVTVKWGSAHYLIDVTYNGETRTYGDVGQGKGQGIDSNQVKYKFAFNGKSNDIGKTNSWTSLKSMLTYYSKLKVPEQEKELEELQFNDVAKVVGYDGAFIKLRNSNYDGWDDTYAYMYDIYEDNINRDVADSMRYTWYDGRYYNDFGYFEKGTTFGNESTSSTATKPSITIKNAVIKLPEDDNYVFWCGQTNDDGTSEVWYYWKIDELKNYDKNTGEWSDFTTYYYDSNSNTYKANLYVTIYSVDPETGVKTEVEDADFIDAYTLTLDEIREMDLDYNTNVDPTEYYIYDGTVPPGTKSSSGK